MARKPCRSRDDRLIAGVCGGLAKWFDVDPLIVRVIAVVSVLISGVGLVAYPVLWIVAPLEDSSTV